MASRRSEMKFFAPAKDTSRAFVEGKFDSNGQRTLAAENKRIAEVTQAFVVRHMEGGYRRPMVSSGRLAKVTANSKNIYATAFRIGVGDPSYLDSSTAKYWRTIEEGSKATWKKRSFLTLDLRGTFGATLVGDRGGPDFSTPAGKGPANGAGKFVPSGPYWRSPVTGKSYRMPVFHPTHEIAPMGSYAAAVSESQFAEQGFAAARKYLISILNRAGGKFTQGEDFSLSALGYQGQ